MALIKLLENTLDESLKLKNMSEERLGCLNKSLLSQNFYQRMSDISQTLISHPEFNLEFPIVNYSLLKISSSGVWSFHTPDHIQH